MEVVICSDGITEGIKVESLRRYTYERDGVTMTSAVVGLCVMERR